MTTINKLRKELEAKQLIIDYLSTKLSMISCPEGDTTLSALACEYLHGAKRVENQYRELIKLRGSVENALEIIEDDIEDDIEDEERDEMARVTLLEVKETINTLVKALQIESGQ